ncbi:unnamed protein product [Brassica oleracea var. botrytis]
MSNLKASMRRKMSLRWLSILSFQISFSLEAFDVWIFMLEAIGFFEAVFLAVVVPTRRGASLFIICIRLKGEMHRLLGKLGAYSKSYHTIFSKL